jgi:hypothetical protein
LGLPDRAHPNIDNKTPKNKQLVKNNFVDLTDIYNSPANYSICRFYFLTRIF